MLLFEALEKIKNRQASSDYIEMDGIVQNMDADIIAMKCIRAQMRLADLLNDYWCCTGENDTYSAQLVYEMLSGIRFDAKFDEDGMFDLEATDGKTEKD